MMFDAAGVAEYSTIFSNRSCQFRAPGAISNRSWRKGTRLLLDCKFACKIGQLESGLELPNFVVEGFTVKLDKYTHAASS